MILAKPMPLHIPQTPHIPLAIPVHQLPMCRIVLIKGSLEIAALLEPKLTLAMFLQLLV
jgi:hypothetical protein